jgi:hypothetical protein
VDEHSLLDLVAVNLLLLLGRVEFHKNLFVVRSCLSDTNDVLRIISYCCLHIYVDDLKVYPTLREKPHYFSIILIIDTPKSIFFFFNVNNDNY